MFNFSLKNKLFGLSFKSKEAKFDELKNKTSNLNLVNPDEILDFICDKEDIIDLIQQTHVLIKKYFPEADVCLKFHRDMCCCKPKDKLKSHVNAEDDDTWAERYHKLISEYVDLKSNYPDYILIHSITFLEA